MSAGAISEGEANDIRARLRALEDDADKAHARAEAAHSRLDVNEAKSEARYRNIILLLLGIAAANSFAAFPHLVQILAFLK